LLAVLQQLAACNIFTLLHKFGGLEDELQSRNSLHLSGNSVMRVFLKIVLQMGDHPALQDKKLSITFNIPASLESPFSGEADDKLFVFMFII
jgi:hypothetical protein